MLVGLRISRNGLQHERWKIAQEMERYPLEAMYVLFSEDGDFVVSSKALIDGVLESMGPRRLGGKDDDWVRL